MTFPVGSLVSARGREWVVLPESEDDLLVLRPVGGAAGEEAGVLPALEEVRPATFRLPGIEDLGDHRSAGLLRDAVRLGFRSSAGPFRSFGRIAVEPRPYQLVPLLMALKMDTVRLLIADDVGIGKTVEALLIAREMLDTGQVRGLSVLCSPQLAEQWQREMAQKFHLDAALVLPSTVRSLERGSLGARESLFDRYPITVVSTDYIKQDRRRDEFLRSAPQLVIIDEAHTCVAADGVGSGRQLRAQLVKGLAADPDRHLILATATPHSGKGDAFRALLALLDPSFAELPDELGGAANEAERTRLARHYVQRKRADIRAYLGEETSFPRREVAEHAYALRPGYALLFDQCLQLAREAVVTDSGGARGQRVRWWSVLALLRSVASSPRAASSTLTNRALTAEGSTAADVDAIGRETVLDQAVDEAAEDVDLAAGAQVEDDGLLSPAKLRELAKLAAGLEGPAEDAKLDDGIRMVQQLLKDGHNPIVFCRFIPTAEYLAEHLTQALGKKAEVGLVTGTLPHEEREARVEALGRHDGPRVLVATDCMSEGINLQQHFDAVVHYDLSWNPTRHEQREGRVDRYGQAKDTVRVVSYYGKDNQIDGLVLDVLLRKHEEIRRATGVSVPVPREAEAIIETIVKSLVARGERLDTQMQLTEVVEQVIDNETRDILAEWDDAADRERRSQTKYAQRAIHVDEVAAQVAAVRGAVGTHEDVERFVTTTARALGATIDARRQPIRFDFSEAPERLRAVLGPKRERFVGRFEGTHRDDEELLLRTHPVVEALAEHIVGTAVDATSDAVARRASVIRTDAVSTRTTLLLVRFRCGLVEVRAGEERPMLAEDVKVLGFEGAPDRAEWVDEEVTDRLFRSVPTGNVAPEQAERMLERIVEGFDALLPALHDRAHRVADELESQHSTVRDAVERRGRVTFECEPHLPPDVLGLYVLLPAGGVA